MTKRFFSVMFLPVMVVALAASAFGVDSVIEEIVARVNNSIITRSDLQKARDQLTAELRDKPADAADPGKREKDLLRDLIDQQLLIQKASDLGITGDTELIKRLDEIRKSMNLESMEDLEKAATQQGVSYEDFKQNLKNGIVTQATIGREVGSKIHITQDEEQQFYDEHKKELEMPEQVRIGEILVAPLKSAEGPKDSATPDATSEAEAKAAAAAEARAKELLAQIKGGAKFEDVAEKSSDGPTASQGGDLGYFRRGMLAKELEDKTFDQMKAGDTSEVIRTRQGFIILRVIEHQAAGVPPFKDMENRVQETLYLRKLQPALRDYLTRLREEAFIDLKPGLVDTGASPNQTKPIMASAEGESGGSKETTKKKKKFLLF